MLETILADQTSLEVHIENLITARQKADGAQWEMGDEAAAIEAGYGEHDLEHAAERAEIEYETLKRYRSVAGAYELGNRFPNLSFKHHMQLAARPDRLYWLALAADNKWSVRTMLAEIEAAEAAQLAQAEYERQLAILAKQNEGLAERVANGELDVKSALAEAAMLQRKADEERREYEGRVRRNSTSLAACVSYAVEQLAHPEGRAVLLRLYDASKSDNRFVVTQKALQQAAENLSLFAEEWS